MTKQALFKLILYPIVFLFFTSIVHAEFSLDEKFIYPEYSKKISMDFKNAALNDVLKIFSQQSGLNFIASETVSEKKVTLYLDNVPVEEALERILSANNLTYEIQPGSDIFVVKPVTRSPVEKMTRVYALNHATVKSSKLKSTIKIGEDDEKESSSSDDQNIGIASAVRTVLSDQGMLIEDPRTNSLIITDIPAQFPIIEQTIARLDVPVPQVLIEVEMLDVSEKTADLIGIKIGDTPLTFTGAERDHVYPWNQNELLRKGYTFAQPEYRVGTISAAGLSATLQMIKTQTDTKSLARPRLLTLNNETAEIKITTDEAIGISTQTGASEGLTNQSLEAERVETGVSLKVTPQVNLLTKTITLAVVPKVIEAKTGATFQGQSFKDPEERATQSILRVHDGETVIIGGLLRDEGEKVTTKVPVLGDIPVIGAAFRHKDTDATQRELIVFLTPHIIPYNDRAKLAQNKPRKNLIREQSMDSSRMQEINKALATMEYNQK